MCNERVKEWESERVREWEKDCPKLKWNSYDKNESKDIKWTKDTKMSQGYSRYKNESRMYNI